jgi:hypothetical protein
MSIQDEVRRIARGLPGVIEPKELATQRATTRKGAGRAR